MSDVQIFVKKCLDMKVREVAVLMVASKQTELDTQALNDWAGEFGIGVTFFHGWQAFSEQVLYWAPASKPIAAKQAVQAIYDRLIEVEASEDAIKSWTVRSKG